MSHCATCGARFQGNGHHCIFHKSKNHRFRNPEYYSYSSDSTYPDATHLRTSQGTVGMVVPRRSRHSRGYNDAHAITLYSHHDTPPVETPLAYTLAQSFTTLQDTHVIASLSYSVTPSGTQTLIAEANLDREQCTICYSWFPNNQKLDHHQRANPLGCETHGVCMPMEDALWHGTKERHERCFVKGCGSVYRKEGGWKAGVVEGHVRAWHC